MTAGVDPVADIPAALVAAVDREARRRSTAGRDAPPDGIDFVEVVPRALARGLGIPMPVSRHTILVHLLHGPTPAWTIDDVRVVGGVRTDPTLNPVTVEWAEPAARVAGTTADPDPALPPGVSPADRTLVRAAVAEEERERVFVVRTNRRGDLSDYLLRIVDPGDRVGLPDGLDPPLAQDGFSFRIDCANPLDCRVARDSGEPWSPQPVLDYLARDFSALSVRLLDRLTTLIPDWTDRNPADLVVALAELWAYLGDRWAYAQDAAAVEAYLTTARQRASIRRHARALSYPMHDGCSARTWLAFDVDADMDLPLATPVSDAGETPRAPGAPAWTPAEATDAGALVFETTRRARLLRRRNALPLHPWSAVSHVLPAGATAAFVTTDAGVDPELRAGDVLVLAELPPGGAPAPELGDPQHRQAVRLERDAVLVPDPFAPATAVWEIRWVVDDALRAPLRVSEPDSDGSPLSRAVALGNVVLADQGASITAERLPQVDDRPFRPRLARPLIAFIDHVDPLAGQSGGASSATAATRPAVARARAAVRLDDGDREWRAVRDLISSSRIDPHTVVEPEESGVARLRFGDGVTGRKPPGGTVFTAAYRVGAGAAGDVAPGVLSEVLRSASGGALASAPRVWNPLPATGGRDPEPLEVVRQLAPQAFRTQLRAVTTDDYARTAELVPTVQRAVARRRWNGSWHAVEVTLDPVAAHASDARVIDEVTQLLETRRMAGLDVETGRPLIVPLLIRLSACALPGFVAAHVLAGLRDALSARRLPGGRAGLFHADAITFGTPLRLSDVVAAAMTVPGVAWVDVTRFGRLDDSDGESSSNLAAGLIRVSAREVFRCDSDVNAPESGRVEIEMRGGL